MQDASCVFVTAPWYVLMENESIVKPESIFP